MVLVDYDDMNSYHPEQDNPVLFEWGRRNIENYLLVPTAWMRAVLSSNMGIPKDHLDLLAHLDHPMRTLIDDFFAGENLILPQGKQWRTLSTQIFKIVDGKKLLFEDDNSLFQKLKTNKPSVEIIRETVAINMTADEIHEDVFAFFDKLKSMMETTVASTIS